jgi:CRISPR-associated protein Cmr6
MREKGTLKVKEDKKKKPYAEIDLGKKKPMRIPDGFELDFSKIDDKEAEVERENGQIIKLFIDGQEITKKSYNPPAKQQRSYPKQEYQSHNRKQSYQTHSQPNASGELDVPDSLDIGKTKLPRDIRIDFKDHIKDIDNFALKLNKAARFDENTNDYTKSKFKFFETTKGKVLYQIKPNFGDLKFEDFKTKMDRIKTSLESQGYKITDTPISMKLDWRLIVGLGNESVYETYMTLHHTYGIPYIPGSAVKGVLRSYVITVVFGDGYSTDNFKEIEKLIELDEKMFKEMYKTDKDLQDKLGTRSDDNPDPNRMEITKENFKKARKIFGNQNQQGQVIFFDAFPTEAPTIEPDIMNPHYGPYYSDGKPPADYHNPVPLFFLTVKDAEFEFHLGMKPKDKDEQLLETAKCLLCKALKEHGIGAKTAVGYGYFR